ncbi:Cortexillin-1 [Madurella mycetomatis]|uniref:Cortexillin-1 n=1 Tax=Madurella mycetomatis TaxID=100816 RepID=A0A175W8X4_9PEZI|nr:Cortexillin-1 [Madurella mycetomatis]
MASYVLSYPFKCWACQTAWAEAMWPKTLDSVEVQVRLRAIYGSLESERELRRRVDRVMDEVKQLIGKCNKEAMAKENALDSELQQILRDIHREPCTVVECQERLDRVAQPVDYAKFENDRRHIIENSRGTPGS